MVTFALVADFVSAPAYGAVFLAIALSDAIAIAILVWQLRLKKISPLGACLPALVVAFTLLDVGLRMIVGVRVLDVFS